MIGIMISISVVIIIIIISIISAIITDQLILIDFLTEMAALFLGGSPVKIIQNLNRYPYI